MHVEEVEIYSDASNAAIMRHPGRRFPGLLVQGDTLYTLFRQAEEVCAAASGKLTEDEYDELDQLRERLRTFVDHYKNVLHAHQIKLPFYEGPGS